MQTLLSCAGKPCPQHTAWTRASYEERDARFMLRLVSGQPQAFVPWERNAKHLLLNYSKIHAGMQTPICGNILLSPLDGKVCPHQGTARLVAPHGQHVRRHTWVFAQGSALVVWTPDPMVAGMSRALAFLLGGSWTQSAIFYIRCRDKKDILAWSAVIRQTISLAVRDAQWYK